MNLKYVEPTGHDYPKQIESIIPASKENGTSTCCTFNRRGTLLAVGCAEGHVNIWDFETRSIASKLQKHEGIVTSVSWSRNGSKLLSSDWNGLLILSDIASSSVLIEVECNLAIEHSWLHGRSSKLAMIHLHECEPLILTFSHRQTITTKTQKTEQIINANIKITNHSAANYQICAKPIELSHFLPVCRSNSQKKKKKKAVERISCAVFDKFAEHIYCGTSHGRLLIIEYGRWRMLKCDKITNGQQQIKSIVFSRCGNFIVVNCGDRIIRYVEINKQNSLCIVRKQYQDAVERKNWNAACFSSNGEYICAASAKRSVPTIYIWQRCYERSLEKVLTQSEKGADHCDTFVVDMVWHPIQSILVSVTQCGHIIIWNQNWRETGENWSTFDANFEILTENVMGTATATTAKAVQQENEEENGKIIDIFKEEGNLEDFFSADEDEKDLLDANKDSLKNELIHLPISVNGKYSSDQIEKYLQNVKKLTNEWKPKANANANSIKISNKNEKVLFNLTNGAAMPKKKRKKKIKQKQKEINCSSDSNKMLPQKRTFPHQNNTDQPDSKKLQVANQHLMDQERLVDRSYVRLCASIYK